MRSERTEPHQEFCTPGEGAHNWCRPDGPNYVGCKLKQEEAAPIATWENAEAGDTIGKPKAAPSLVADLASGMTAVISKGGLSFDLSVDGIPHARVRLDADSPEYKRQLVAALVHAVNHTHRCALALEDSNG